MYIVYITTNLKNDRVYIGVHEQSEPYEFDGYLGSGKGLKAAVKKYGKENFVRETLFYYWYQEEAYKKEAEIVTEEFINQKWNYNISVGGYKGPSTKGIKQKPETIAKRMLKIKGRKRPDMSGKNNYFYKNPRPKEEASKRTKGSKTYNNGIIERRYWEDDKIEEGFVKGRIPFSDEYREKRSQVMKEKYANGWVHPGLNKKRSEESKKRMSDVAKGRTWTTQNGVRVFSKVEVV